MSITVATTKRKAIEAGKFTLDGVDIPWESAGIQAVDIDAGTGYHIPEGSLAFLSGKMPSAVANTRETVVPATAVKAWLLRIAEDGPAQFVQPPAA
ncbi:MAG: hypothetical protein H7232_03325 [Aeromicrobium sp.]|nr:hypothetical protein [Burkholderiales bacterium]